MQIQPSLARFGALTAVLIEWSSWWLFYAIRPQEFVSQHAISYFATLPDTRLIFSASYILASVSFWLFVRIFLSGRLRFQLWPFAWSMASFGFVAIFPYHPDVPLSNGIHLAAFIVTAVTFMIGMYEVSRRSDDEVFRAYGLGLTGLATVVYLSLVVTGGNSPVVLYWEVGWWLICQVWMILLSIRSFYWQKIS